MAKLRFVGRLGDLARDFPDTLPVGPGVCVKHLKDAIAARDPALGAAVRAPTTRTIVNEGFATDAHPLCDADEIAFLPPVSGG